MTPFDDKLKEECGVFGIFNSKEAAVNVALGLHALQHRGQEAAGIVSCDNGSFAVHFADGLVGDNFNSAEIVSKLKGDIAIGHVRYSTAGKKTARNYQPIFAEFSFGCLAIAHNGNLTNANTLRKSLIERGSIFQSSMDTEVIIHLIALSQKNDLIDKIIDAVSQIEGAYSLAIMHKDGLIAIRDPHGVRPLVLGKIGDADVIASETCALDIIGAKFVRDIKNGEVVIINKGGIETIEPFKSAPSNSVFLNISILPAQIAYWKEKVFIRCAKILVLSLRKRQISRLMLSFQFQILECQRRLDMHSNLKFLLNLALSEITM